MKSLPPEISAPHSGCGTGTPKPRKLRPDAIRIVMPRLVVIETMIGAMPFGSTCLKMMRKLDRPTARAASTNSLFLTESVAALVIRM
jgi:hypothetical protein